MKIIYSLLIITTLLCSTSFGQANDINSETIKNPLLPLATIPILNIIGNSGIIATITEELDNNGDTFGVLDLKPANDDPSVSMEGKLWKNNGEELVYSGNMIVDGRVTANTLTLKSGAAAGRILVCNSTSGSATWQTIGEAGSINDLVDGKSSTTSNSVYLGFGSGASDNLNSSKKNTAVGINALNSFSTGGGENTAMGFEALTDLTAGSKNTAFGYQALSLANGSENTAVGYQALLNNSAGTGNVAIGYQAGRDETGSNKLYIHNGPDNDPLIWGDFLAADVKINDNLEVTQGASKPGGGSWSNSSDIRLKNIIGNYEKGLEEVNKLNTVKFRYKTDNVKGLPSEEDQYGFIAQEVQKVFPEAVGVDSDGFLTFNIHSITVAMVNAVSELNDEKKHLSQLLEKAEEENLKLLNANRLFEKRIENIENLLEGKIVNTKF